MHLTVKTLSGLVLFAAVCNSQGRKTEPDIAKNCTNFAVGFVGDDCQTIADFNGITKEQVQEWNPNLRRNCADVKEGYSYCVHVDPNAPVTPPVTPPTITTTSKPVTPPIVTNPPTPPPKSDVLWTKPPANLIRDRYIPSSCNGWYQVQKGDTCSSIPKKLRDQAFLTRGHMMAWNPALLPGCQNIPNAVGYYFCVAAKGIPVVNKVSPP